ncbi:kinase-like domain-containing protein [Amylocystis lapponica]|nr:kinase-like domain-containing protein [Amylocystis lapponica]
MSTLRVPSSWFTQSNDMSDSIELIQDASLDCSLATLRYSSLKGGQLISAEKSDVYLVTLDDGHTRIVCKVTSRRRKAAQLHHEAIMYRILKELQGHSIPQCFGYYTKGEIGCLVLEYCGETLGRTSNDFFVTPVSYKKQAIEILEKIHRIGYKHNDFCAPNIALDNQGKIRVIDFSHGSPHGGTHGCHELKDANKHITIGILQPRPGGLCMELKEAAIEIGAWLPLQIVMDIIDVEDHPLDNPEEIIQTYALYYRPNILEEIS